MMPGYLYNSESSFSHFEDLDIFPFKSSGRSVFPAHLFCMYLLSTYYMPDNVLGTEDTKVNERDQVPDLMELTT